MMPTFTISAGEIDKAVRGLVETSEEFKRDLSDKAVNRSTTKIHREAVNAAPRYDGMVRNGLKMRKSTPHGLDGQVSIDVFYAPYIEFGTKARFGKLSPHARDKTPLDAETREIAAQFRGKAGRGDAKAALAAIKNWARKKGLPKEAAGAIWLSIMRHGVMAQPFLFPAARRERPRYFKQVELLVKQYSAR